MVFFESKGLCQDKKRQAGASLVEGGIAKRCFLNERSGLKSTGATMKFFCELQSLCRALYPEQNVRLWADFCEGQTISCPVPLKEIY
jgi:hypothetical protein